MGRGQKQPQPEQGEGPRGSHGGTNEGGAAFETRPGSKGLSVNKLIFLRLVSTPISVSRILVIAHYDCESAP